MKDIIWLSPSLAAGAIAARFVAFFEKRPQMSPHRAVAQVQAGRCSHADRRGGPWTRRGSRRERRGDDRPAAP